MCARISVCVSACVFRAPGLCLELLLEMAPKQGSAPPFPSPLQGLAVSCDSPLGWTQQGKSVNSVFRQSESCC